MLREGIVNTALLPVYAERDILQIRTDELLYGTHVKITDTKEKDRYRIETDYRYTGLVSSDDVLCIEQRVGEWVRGRRLIVIHRFCDVMSQPTVKSKVIVTLYRGSVLRNLGSAAEPGWHCVQLADGTDGFVRQEQITVYVSQKTELSEKVLRSALVNTAYSYLGTPYRWGGKSTLGIDCSGFTFMVYALNNIYIHRDSAWIPKTPVRKIADCEKKPGDLLYFSGHIALYLGNGEYIHSTAKDGAGVTINSLKRGSAGYRKDLDQSFLYAGTVF